MIRAKITCPLTRCVHFLECPSITDFTAFFSFPFSRAWSAISAVFMERFLYLFLSFTKQFFLSDMVDSEWNILHIRGESCSLATGLYTHIHYIYKVPNMGPLLQKYSIVLTTKKTFIAIKTIKKTRDLENEIENEVTIQKFWIQEPSFRQLLVKL